MTTKVKLFLNVKNESQPRPLGIRHLRRLPKPGQKFNIAIDGRSLRACITRFTTATEVIGGSLVTDVYAEEV